MTNMAMSVTAVVTAFIMLLVPLSITGPAADEMIAPDESIVIDEPDTDEYDAFSEPEADLAECRTITDFMHYYDVTGQLSTTLSAEELEALVRYPNAEVVTGGVRFNLQGAVYDGIRINTLIEASSVNDDLLLIGNYSYDVTDQIPGTEITFEEKAEQEGKTISFVYAGFEDGSSIYDESYPGDGTVLLYVSMIPTKGEMLREEAEFVMQVGALKTDADPEDGVMKFTIASGLEAEQREFTASAGEPVFSEMNLKLYNTAIGSYIRMTYPVTEETIGTDPEHVRELWFMFTCAGSSDLAHECTAMFVGPDGEPASEEIKAGDICTMTVAMDAFPEMPEGITVYPYFWDGGEYEGILFGEDIVDPVEY